jgi:hypothetical protein
MSDGDVRPAGEARPGVPDWEDEYLDRVGDRLMYSYDLERDRRVAGERFALYGRLDVENRKQFLHPAISYGHHEKTGHLFVRRAERVSLTDLERLEALGETLAEEWIEPSDRHYETEFVFGLVADEATVEGTEALLEALNPDARRHRTTHGRVDLDAVLDTGLFDHDTVSETDSWKRALEHAEEHDHGGDHTHTDQDHSDHAHDPQSVYGVTSFPFRADRPLHPERFASFLADLPESVVRSKGIVWVAGRDDVALRYSGVGPSYRAVTVRGNWIATLPEERQETQRRMRPDLPWDEAHGDRRTDLVFIGRGMDETTLRDRLAACPLTDAELEVDPSTFENPFPEEPDGELAFGEPEGGTGFR